MVHELHSVPQQVEHFSPHLQSAEVFEVVVFPIATNEPSAITPAKRNA